MDNVYQFYDNKLGVAIQYLTADRNNNEKSLALINYTTLRKRITSKTSPEKELRKASWSGPALVQFSSLCKEWKNQLIVKFGNPPEKIKENYFKKNFVLDTTAFNWFSNYRYGDHNLGLDEKLIEKYTVQASVLNTVLKIKEERKLYAKALGVKSLDIWQTLSNDVNAFKDEDHCLPTTKDSIRRKTNLFAKEGYESLVSKKLQNNNARKLLDEIQLAVVDELIAKHTNLDNEEISGMYNDMATRLDWPSISAKTVANRKMKSNLVTYAGRNGSSALSNNVLMQTKRKKPSSSMLFWTLDGWDVELLYQDTKIDKSGRKVTTYHNRLCVVMVLDPSNKYPIGYAIGTHETPDLIKKALQNAVSHTKELFGDYYKPHQLQSDRYQIKKLGPIYKTISEKYTPSKAKNAKSKIIEPHFSIINKKYCKLMDNWSGHNVDSGSKNQPNDEVLNKIRHSFPDRVGCIHQIETIIAQERNKKRDEFLKGWGKTAQEFKHKMDVSQYLFLFGLTTGYTNKLRGEGLTLTINGQKLTYDSFDIEFRKLAYLDWRIHFNEDNLDQVLAVGENGKYRFLLDQKYIQPMALADRKDGDMEELSKVWDFNKNVENYIADQRKENIEKVEELFLSKPELNDTLAKLVLVDSRGQHKERKYKEISQEANRVHEKTNKIIDRIESKDSAKIQNNFFKQQEEYYKSKIDIEEFLNID